VIRANENETGTSTWNAACQARICLEFMTECVKPGSSIGDIEHSLNKPNADVSKRLVLHSFTQRSKAVSSRMFEELFSQLPLGNVFPFSPVQLSFFDWSVHENSKAEVTKDNNGSIKYGRFRYPFGHVFSVCCCIQGENQLDICIRASL
jgi:hypothetical protein